MFSGGGLSYETNVSVRGATENNSTNYYLSGLTKYDNGILPNTGYNKQSVRTNVTQAFSQALSVTADVAYTHSLTRRGLTGNDNIGGSPYDVFSYTPQFVNLDHRTANGTWAYNPFGPANPFANAVEMQTPEEVSRFIGGGTVTGRLLSTTSQALQLTLVGGADLAQQRDQLYAPPDLQVESVLPLPGVATSLSANTTFLNYSLNLVHHYTGLSVIDATTSIGIARDRTSFVNPNIVAQALAPGQNAFVSGAVQTGFYAGRRRTICRFTDRSSCSPSMNA